MFIEGTEAMILSENEALEMLFVIVNVFSHWPN